MYRFRRRLKFYKNLIASRKGFVPPDEICQDSLKGERKMIESWKYHYDEPVNDVEREHHDNRRNEQTTREISQLHVKWSFHFELIVRIWDTERSPEMRKDEVICSIYKNGNELECENDHYFPRSLEGEFADHSWRKSLYFFTLEKNLQSVADQAM